MATIETTCFEYPTISVVRRLRSIMTWPAISLPHLCDFLERHELIEEVQLKVVEAHISAIRAYLRQSLKGDGGSVGQELTAELSGLIQRTEAS